MEFSKNIIYEQIYTDQIRRLDFNNVLIHIQEENKALKTEIIELKEKIVELIAENSELKTRLNLNSQNSSKPPSSDGLRKKPAFPRNGKGKKGGQKGHKGKTLHQITTPDIIHNCIAIQCDCGQNLCNEQGQIISKRQVFDLPQPKLYVTEYRIYQTICPVCGKEHVGQTPEGINSQAQYGNGVKAFVTLMNNYYDIGFKKLQSLFFILFGYAINEATIVSANETYYKKLDKTEDIIKSKVLESKTAHNDETGIRAVGVLHWLHVMSTTCFTYLFAHPQRGEKAMLSPKSILGRFTGWIVHDCWKSYFKFILAKHALCNAHILRELEGQIEDHSKWARVFKIFLLTVYNTSFKERIKKRTLIESRYDYICKLADKIEPVAPKKNREGKTQANQRS